MRKIAPLHLFWNQRPILTTKSICHPGLLPDGKFNSLCKFFQHISETWRRLHCQVEFFYVLASQEIAGLPFQGNSTAF